MRSLWNCFFKYEDKLGKTFTELGYRKISWLNIESLANQLFASVFGSGFAATSKPQFFAQPRPLIVKYDSAWPEKQQYS